MYTEERTLDESLVGAVAQRHGHVTLWHITARVTTCSLLINRYLNRQSTDWEPTIFTTQANWDTRQLRSSFYEVQLWWWILVMGGDWEECHPSWWSVRNVTKLQWYTRRHVPERSIVQATNSVSSCPVMPSNCLFQYSWNTPLVRYENKTNEFTWSYVNLLQRKVVNLLHVSANFSSHLQGGIIRRLSHKDVKTNVLT